jgi:predicted molibdopterin-dependent oxidoreductase YjgC
MAEQAERVLVISMFHGLAAGWADLVLPGTSYLERDGTYVNLEGRVQRLRRAVIPPAPDELAWISRLAERFGVEVSPYPSVVFEEVSTIAFGGIPFGQVGEQAVLPPATDTESKTERLGSDPSGVRPLSNGLQLVRYRPLFSGPAVERTPELEFQRPAAEVELSAEDARARNISAGDEVTVSSNGTSVTLRARLAHDVRAGIVRIPEEFAGELQPSVEVKK